MPTTFSEPLTYRDAGVDISAGDAFVQAIKPLVKQTHRPGVLGGIGGFGALFELPLDRYRRPVLVSGTDGVGTKLKLAVEMQQHDTIGIDLVAMCANDILTLGAEPLFFLDYFATGKLQLDAAEAILRGIANGCQQAKAALVGGETAEMPGVYQGDDYDLAGFCVGIVEKDAIIDGSRIQAGHVMIALASSGPHSNGYSLIRHVLARGHHSLNTPLEGKPLGAWLLEPTRIYVDSVLSLMSQLPLDGLVHITGGGLVENIPRILPAGLYAQIDARSWQWPAVFSWLATHGNIPTPEMYRTFNMGVGMVVIVAPEHADRALAVLTQRGEHAWRLGTIETTPNSDAPRVVIQP